MEGIMTPIVTLMVGLLLGFYLGRIIREEDKYELEFLKEENNILRHKVLEVEQNSPSEEQEQVRILEDWWKTGGRPPWETEE
jgi:hypothetical protein